MNCYAPGRKRLTQAEVAELMATQPSVVARLEAGGGRRKHSPSLATLQKYAEAVGCRLEIKMVRVPPARGGYWHPATGLTLTVSSRGGWSARFVVIGRTSLVH